MRCKNCEEEFTKLEKVATEDGFVDLADYVKSFVNAVAMCSKQCVEQYYKQTNDWLVGLVNDQLMAIGESIYR